MNVYLYIICGMVTTFLLCVGSILFYLKYRKNILQKQFQIKAAEVQYQKELLKAIIHSQEEERKRIGMDLHDEVGSKLSSLRLYIDHFADNNRELISFQQFNLQCKTHIDSIITNVRNISHNLSPILEGVYELLDAIHDFCDNINKSGKIQITIQEENNTSKLALPYLTKLSLYRVITELINNTIKHANAKNIRIQFSNIDNNYEIHYSDDGKGFEIANNTIRKGIGMKNIESRLNSIGVSYTLESSVGKGYSLNISLPLR